MSTDENLLYPEDVQLCKCMCGDWLGTLARTSGEVVVKVLGGITSSSEETVSHHIGSTLQGPSQFTEDFANACI